MKFLDQSAIRRQNVLKMLQLLTGHAPRTRQSLADDAHLSLMTVSNLVEQLRAQNVLSLTPVDRSSTRSRAAGRKAENIALSGEKHLWLIIDLSGSHFFFTLMAFDLCTLLEGSAPTEGDYAQALRHFLDDTQRQIAPFLHDRQLLGVAVVTPGPYEIATDTVYNQRLPQINALHIKKECREHLGDYEYYVDEDVKFAVRAFTPLIETDSCEMLYYLFIGEGVGGAAVHSLNMMRGLNATAGDPGQLLSPEGGTFESRLSLSAFAAQLQCNVDDLPRLAQENPQLYLTALEKSADEAAAMLECVLWVLDPCRIVIDCRYAAHLEEPFVSRIRYTLSRRFAASGRRLPQFFAAPKGMSSILRGAVQVLQREWVERLWN